MNRAQVNHLRKLLAWVRCEIGQSPEELVETVRDISGKWDGPISPDAERRLVEAHDKARSVPKYVREAIKSLEPLTKPGDVIASGSPSMRVLRQTKFLKQATGETK